MRDRIRYWFILGWLVALYTMLTAAYGAFIAAGLIILASKIAYLTGWDEGFVFAVEVSLVVLVLILVVKKLFFSDQSVARQGHYACEKK